MSKTSLLSLLPFSHCVPIHRHPHPHRTPAGALHFLDGRTGELEPVGSNSSFHILRDIIAFVQTTLLLTLIE